MVKGRPSQDGVVVKDAQSTAWTRDTPTETACPLMASGYKHKERNMRKLHDGIESRDLLVQVKLDNGDNFPVGKVDGVYVSEDGKHVILHTVLPNGKRRIETHTNVSGIVIVGA